MKRTREEIIADIEYNTKWAEYWAEESEYCNKVVTEYRTKQAEYHTKKAKEARKELKELDGEENEKN